MIAAGRLDEPCTVCLSRHCDGHQDDPAAAESSVSTVPRGGVHKPESSRKLGTSRTTPPRNDGNGVYGEGVFRLIPSFRPWTVSRPGGCPRSRLSNSTP